MCFKRKQLQRKNKEKHWTDLLFHKNACFFNWNPIFRVKQRSASNKNNEKKQLSINVMGKYPERIPDQNAWSSASNKMQISHLPLFMHTRSKKRLSRTSHPFLPSGACTLTHWWRPACAGDKKTTTCAQFLPPSPIRFSAGPEPSFAFGFFVCKCDFMIIPWRAKCVWRLRQICCDTAVAAADSPAHAAATSLPSDENFSGARQHRKDQRRHRAITII